MIKRTVTFEDFDGNTVSEDFFFNLSKSELLELELEYKDGFSDALQAIIKAEDTKSLIREFKKLLLLSYGRKSDDGKRFIKSDQLREEFTQTPAFDVLFMELATDDKLATEFIKGILPREISMGLSAENEAIKQQAVAAITQTLPPPPTSTVVDL